MFVSSSFACQLVPSSAIFDRSDIIGVGVVSSNINELVTFKLLYQYKGDHIRTLYTRDYSNMGYSFCLIPFGFKVGNIYSLAANFEDDGSLRVSTVTDMKEFISLQDAEKFIFENTNFTVQDRYEYNFSIYNFYMYKNYALVGGVFILVGFILYFFRKRRKNKI